MSVTAKTPMWTESPGSWRIALLLCGAAVAIAFLATHGFLTILVCIALGFLAFSRLDLFVYLQILLLPWYPFLSVGSPIRDVTVILRFVFLGAVWLKRSTENASLRDWIFGGIKKKPMLLAGAMALALVASDYPATLSAYQNLLKMFSYIAFYYGLAGWLDSKDKLVKTTQLMLMSTIVVALFGFYQSWDNSFTSLYFRLNPMAADVLEDVGGWGGRITSFLFHYNSLAGYLNLVIPFALGSLIVAKHLLARRLAFICATTATAALYFTGSRGGWIAYLCMVAVVCWYSVNRKTAICRVATVLLIAGAMVIMLSLVGSDQRDINAGAVQTERATSVDAYIVESRLALWQAAAQMFMQHPLLGIGFGNYRVHFQEYMSGIDYALDAHNIYLQFLAECGIVGFVCFMVVMISFFRAGARLVRELDEQFRIIGLGVCGALMATLVHGGVDYLFGVSPQFGNMFFLVLALATVAAELVAQRQNYAVPSLAAVKAGV